MAPRPALQVAWDRMVFDESEKTAGPHDPMFVAEQRIRHGDPRGAMREILKALLSDPLDEKALAVATRMTHLLGAAREEQAFAGLAAAPDDPETRYELGYLLVDSGQERLGARYLELCLEAAPGTAAVEYELGFARMRCGELVAAEPLLERAFESEALTDDQSFSAGSLLVECRVRAGNAKAARATLARLETWSGDRDEAQIDALAALVTRAETLERIRAESGDDATWGSSRDHAFILAASILLHQPRNANTFTSGIVSLDFLAGLLRRLERALSVVDFRPRVVTSPIPELKPLVFALAARLDATPLETLDDEPATLVLMRHPLDARPHMAQLRDVERASFLFALAVDPRRDHSIAPDCIGVLAERLVLPWEAHIEIGAEDPAGTTPLPRIVPRNLESEQRLGDELARAMHDLEGDDDDLAAIERYYRPLEKHLFANRPDTNPLRRTMPFLLAADAQASERDL